MMPRFMRLFLLITAVLLLASAAPAEAKPTTKDCFACHDRAAFQKRVKHQPVVGGDCSVCHSPHVARHQGLLQQQVQSLCYFCHPTAAAEHRRGLAHEPVRLGECLACHDPHSSDHPGLLSRIGAESCFDCHSELPRKFRHTHTPYAKGECASCHRAHQSEQPYLLVKDAAALCLNCHSAQTVKQKHPNYPVAPGNCSSCHNPHGSDRPALVRNLLHQPYREGCKSCHSGQQPVTVQNCLSCHPQVGEEMASSNNHLVRYGNNSCTACHSPHAGDQPGLLKGKERHICWSCHESTFQRTEQAAHQHPLTKTKEGSCTQCHALHGSNHPAMVKGPINTVCISCHAEHEQFTHPIGEQVFDPRTGQMMTCISCHATRGSEHEKHLRHDGRRALCTQCHRDH